MGVVYVTCGRVRYHITQLGEGPNSLAKLERPPVTSFIRIHNLHSLFTSIREAFERPALHRLHDLMSARASFHITPWANDIASIYGIDFDAYSTFEKSLKNIGAAKITDDAFGDVRFVQGWEVAVGVGFLLS